jgi:hypothetical protein
LSPGDGPQGLDQTRHRAVDLDPAELALGVQPARHAPSPYIKCSFFHDAIPIVFSGSIRRIGNGFRE